MKKPYLIGAIVLVIGLLVGGYYIYQRKVEERRNQKRNATEELTQNNGPSFGVNPSGSNLDHPAEETKPDQVPAATDKPKAPPAAPSAPADKGDHENPFSMQSDEVKKQMHQMYETFVNEMYKDLFTEMHLDDEQKKHLLDHLVKSNELMQDVSQMLLDEKVDLDAVLEKQKHLREQQDEKLSQLLSHAQVEELKKYGQALPEKMAKTNIEMRMDSLDARPEVKDKLKEVMLKTEMSNDSDLAKIAKSQGSPLELDKSSMKFARELMVSTTKNDPTVFKRVVAEMESNNAKILKEMAGTANEKELEAMKKRLYEESNALKQSFEGPEVP